MTRLCNVNLNYYSSLALLPDNNVMFSSVYLTVVVFIVMHYDLFYINTSAFIQALHAGTRTHSSCLTVPQLFSCRSSPVTHVSVFFVTCLLTVILVVIRVICVSFQLFLPIVSLRSAQLVQCLAYVDLSVSFVYSSTKVLTITNCMIFEFTSLVY